MRYLILTLLVLYALSRAGAAAPATPEKRPDILFIIADDQSPQPLRAYGNTVCQTPNLDRPPWLWSPSHVTKQLPENLYAVAQTECLPLED